MKYKETETLELKKSTSELRDGIKSICAILNKHQKGKLIFGVKPSGEVVGQEVGANTLRDISQQIANSIEPKIFPEVYEEIIEGKDCIVVEFEGLNIPYYAYGRAYMRVSDEDRLLSAKELERLILDKNKDKLRWDSEICEGASLKDISEENILKFRERYKEINKIKIKGSKNNLLKSLGCLREIGGEL
ncbi:ATP-dependent DNA helicase, partial [archaeon]|nr:ATP-dependent DNA helicase [archaeon]